MVTRTEIYWADLPPPTGRRPVCVLTRDSAATVLNSITCAPITTTKRGIRSEVEVGPSEGLTRLSVIACDSILTVPRSMLDPTPVGSLGLAKRVELDRALRFALGVIY